MFPQDDTTAVRRAMFQNERRLRNRIASHTKRGALNLNLGLQFCVNSFGGLALTAARHRCERPREAPRCEPRFLLFRSLTNALGHRMRNGGEGRRCRVEQGERAVAPKSAQTRRRDTSPQPKLSRFTKARERKEQLRRPRCGEASHSPNLDRGFKSHIDAMQLAIWSVRTGHPESQKTLGNFALAVAHDVRSHTTGHHLEKKPGRRGSDGAAGSYAMPEVRRRRKS